MRRCPEDRRGQRRWRPCERAYLKARGILYLRLSGLGGLFAVSILQSDSSREVLRKSTMAGEHGLRTWLHVVGHRRMASKRGQ